MQHPLPERIGNPDLLVGRAYEFDLFDKWLNRIPQRLAKSRVILARRKSGKTAIVQRIFNMLWNEERGIIPFYYNIAEVKTRKNRIGGNQKNQAKNRNCFDAPISGKSGGIRQTVSQAKNSASRSVRGRFHRASAWILPQAWNRDGGADSLFSKLVTMP